VANDSKAPNDSSSHTVVEQFTVSNVSEGFVLYFRNDAFVLASIAVVNQLKAHWFPKTDLYVAHRIYARTFQR